MKQTLLILLAVFAFSSGAYSQSFQYVKIGADTNIYTGAEPDAAYTYAYMKNTGTTTLQLRLQRTFNSLAANWTSSLCYGLCYAEFIDVIPPTNEPPITLAPGQQDTMDVTWYVPNNGIGTVKVKLFNTANTSEFIERTFNVRRGTVGITPINSIVKNFELKQNYPNPFNPTTNINFSIPKNQNVSLKVYDMMGKEVASLVNNEFLKAGEYKADFNAANLSSGVYYYALKTDEFTSTKSMILVK
jgi:hypothetical protein